MLLGLSPSVLHTVVDVDASEIPSAIVDPIFAQLAAAHSATADETGIGTEAHLAMQRELMTTKFIPDQAGNLHSIGGDQGIGSARAQRLVAEVMKLAPGPFRAEQEEKMFTALTTTMEKSEHARQSAVLRFLLDQIQREASDLVLVLLTFGGPSDAFASDSPNWIGQADTDSPFLPASSQMGFMSVGRGCRR